MIDRFNFNILIAVIAAVVMVPLALLFRATHELTAAQGAFVWLAGTLFLFLAIVSVSMLIVRDMLRCERCGDVGTIIHYQRHHYVQCGCRRTALCQSEWEAIRIWSLFRPEPETIVAEQ